MRFFKTPPRYFEELGRVSIRIWREIHESGDLSLLCTEGTPDKEGMEKAWHKLNNEFLEVYGLDRKTKEMLKLQYRLAEAMAKFLSTGDRSYNMEVKLLQEDIIGHKKTSGEGATFIEVIAMVEQTMGFQIDEDTTTVKKFYSYIKQIKQQAKKQQEQLNKFKNGKKDR